MIKCKFIAHAFFGYFIGYSIYIFNTRSFASWLRSRDDDEVKLTGEDDREDISIDGEGEEETDEDSVIDKELEQDDVGETEVGVVVVETKVNASEEVPICFFFYIRKITYK